MPNFSINNSARRSLLLLGVNGSSVSNICRQPTTANKNQQQPQEEEEKEEKRRHESTNVQQNSEQVMNSIRCLLMLTLLYIQSFSQHILKKLLHCLPINNTTT